MLTPGEARDVAREQQGMVPGRIVPLSGNYPTSYPRPVEWVDQTPKVLDEPRGEPKYVVKDSGERARFDSGMVRDVTAGKLDWWRLFIGPMARRLVDHVTKGAVKYPDIALGVPNWTLADGEGEKFRFRASAVRHFVQWLDDEEDEDHAAAVEFNINGYEYVKDKMRRRGQ